MAVIGLEVQWCVVVRWFLIKFMDCTGKLLQQVLFVGLLWERQGTSLISFSPFGRKKCFENHFFFNSESNIFWSTSKRWGQWLALCNWDVTWKWGELVVASCCFHKNKTKSSHVPPCIRFGLQLHWPQLFLSACVICSSLYFIHLFPICLPV